MRILPLSPSLYIYIYVLAFSFSSVSGEFKTVASEGDENRMAGMDGNTGVHCLDSTVTGREKIKV